MGEVKLGATYKELRRQDLVGASSPGCPIKQGERIAPLKAPLKGGVILTASAPRKVDNIGIRGGATIRGVGVGATIPEIKAAFPKAKVNRQSEELFRITSVEIPQEGGGRLLFAVDVKTKKTRVIGIPTLPPCE